MFEKDHEGNTALHVVCDWDYLEIARTLCDVIDTQLEAQGKGHDTSDDSDEKAQLTRKPQKKKNDKKWKSPLKMRNKQGLTPVEVAYEENT